MGKQRKKTRISSKIDELPEIVRTNVDVMLADTSNTYQDISVFLKSQGYEISKSSVGRYAMRSNSAMQRLLEAQQQTEKLVQVVKQNPDADYTEAGMRMLMDGLINKMATAEEEFDQMPLDKAGRLLASLSRTKVYKDKAKQEMQKKADLAFKEMEQEILKVIKQDERSVEALKEILNRAKELAAKIQLSLAMFSGKMDRTRVIYEQDSGELDEDELYQSRYNRNIFFEEVMAPSAILEVVILLDLSGSMCTGDKIPMQIVISSALALAFNKYPNVVYYSIYGHRCGDEGIEIIRFHDRGEKLQLGKLFSQQALNANADGYAMLYCFDKFKSDAKNKLFFMISDGAPSATGYDGENAREHVWEVVREGKKRGIEVLSVGIDNFEQADMYEVYFLFRSGDHDENLSMDS